MSPLRILIIDDDRRRRPTDDPSLPREERLPSAGESARDGGEHASGSLVRELTMPTPIPGSIPRFDLLDGGAAAVPADAGFLRELIARVQELLRQTRDRPESHRGTIVPDLPAHGSELTLDLGAQAVLKRGRPVNVTRTEFRLLIALMRRRGAVASPCFETARHTPPGQ